MFNMTTGAVVLAGGHSNRMGNKDKALLDLNGRTFLDKIIQELQGFDEILLSADQKNRYIKYQDITVPDVFPNTGPAGALYSALSSCQSNALLVVTCDMPLFTKELGEYLLSYLSSDWDALIIEDRSGKIHPLCGIYQKAILPILLEQIKNGNYRMTSLLNRLCVKRIQLSSSAFSDECVSNINRPCDYAKLLQRQKRPTVVAISGVKNSGKTTFIEKIVPMLKEKGYQLAVIKHDGHDFQADIPGTDSYRFQQAGAGSVAVFSNKQYMIIRHAANTSFEGIISLFADADIILLEGGKDTTYPKIELIRQEVSDHSVCDPSTLLAIMTNTGFQSNGVTSFDINNVAAAVSIIDDYAKEALTR